jgi:hypothetical protein
VTAAVLRQRGSLTSCLDRPTTAANRAAGSGRRFLNCECPLSGVRFKLANSRFWPVPAVRAEIPWSKRELPPRGSATP